jgi:hypothetical protein
MNKIRVSWRPEGSWRRYGVLVGYLDGTPQVRWHNKVQPVSRAALTFEEA